MKESKELLVGIIALAKEVQALAKDGVDLSDVVAISGKIAQDEVFRSKLIEAVKGADLIAAEWQPVTVEKVLDVVISLAIELSK